MKLSIFVGDNFQRLSILVSAFAPQLTSGPHRLGGDFFELIKMGIRET
jgi:hypothetical protein